mgnify:CR=1 FL=1
MPSKKRATPISLQPLDALFGTSEETTNGISEIAIGSLHPFPNHPFQVKDDKKMEELSESITQYGVLVPGIVRLRESGGYEIVAGHRRKRACELAGLEKMPVIIRDMSDDEATVVMVDSNIQRENLLYSEKAFAYRMKYEALKRQGRRTDLTLVQVEPKLKKRWAAEMVGTEVGETMSTIKRYIRLTYLSNYLLEFVDKNELPFTVAVDLSYLKSNEQSLLLAFIGATKKMPNGSQAKKLKELSQQKELTGEDIEKILRGEAKVNYQKISFSEKQLQKYFPPDYKKEQIEKIIFQLLDSWKAQTERRG